MTDKLFVFISKFVSLSKSASRIFLSKDRRRNLFRGRHGDFLKPSDGVLVRELVDLTNDSDKTFRSALTAHIYYSDFTSRLANAWKNQVRYEKLFVTVSSEQIKATLESEMQGAKKPYEIVVAQNRGRNFGPLFVDLLPKLDGFDYFAHLHSKMSTHSPKNFAGNWADISWQLLLESDLAVEKLFQIMASEISGLIYAAPPDEILTNNFYWNSNRSIGKEVLKELMSLDIEDGRLYFPVGGMFLAKLDALEPLLKKKWKYSDFPKEKNQIDGTLHHVLERLIGVTAFKMGYSHAVYDSNSDKYYELSDSSIFRER